MMTGILGDPGAMAEALLHLAWKGSLLLTSVAALTLVMRRAPAAARHLVWFLGAMALLILPVLEAAAPAWQVPLPDVLRGGAESRAVAVPDAVAPPPPPAPVSTARPPAPPAPAAVPAAPEPAPPARELRSDADGAGTGMTPGTDASLPGPASPGSTPGRADSGVVAPGLLVVGGWAAGALLLLVSLGRSLVAVRHLEGRAAPFPEGRATRLARELARHLGIARPVRILRGGPDVMPMSWGITRPTVLLPAGADRWHATRLESVLLHELAHVRRRDCLTQTLAEAVRALHWFNPVAWLAVHRLRVEREHACDDLVLTAGARPSVYAEELLSLARGFQVRRGTSLAAVAMARPGDLRRRLTAVLAPERARVFSTRGAGFAVAGVLLLALPLAALAPAPHSPVVADASSTTPAAPSETPPAVEPGRADDVAAALPAPRPAGIPFPTPSQEATCGMASDGWRSHTSNRNDDRHRLEWSRDGCRVEVEVRGEVEFGTDFRSVARLGPDALLRLEEEEGRTTRRLDVTAGPGGAPDWRWTVDGERREFDASARAWFEGMLLQVFRRGGYLAEERVEALLDRGSVQAVLDELAFLDADHVFSLYVEHLLELERLDEGQVVGLLERADRRVDSDHYMAGILEAALVEQPLTDRVVDAALEISRGMDSDHYRAQVLDRALDREDLGAGQVRVLLASASDMDSDHYKAEVLKGVAERYSLEPEVRGTYLETAAGMDSDHYKSEVLTGLLARNDLEPGELADVVRAAGGMDSDHYVAEVLGRVADTGLGSAPLRTAFFEVGEARESDHYRSQVLMRLLEGGSLDDALVVRVVGSTARMESDHYKSEVLTAVLRTQRVEGPVRDAFVDAMDTVESRHYRGNLAEALLREGRSGG